MNKIILICLLFFNQLFPGDLTGKVVGVKDGDTIVLLSGTNQYTVRLNGIDAPEKKQAFGQRSKEALSSLIFGKQVTVQVTGTDRYSRNLGTVYLSGTDINKKMIESGFAWHYKQYDQTPSYSQAEIAARQSNLGLWADSNPIPPWEYRHGKKTNKTPGSGTTYTSVPTTSLRCQAITKKGTQCKRNAQSGSSFCWQHQ